MLHLLKLFKLSTSRKNVLFYAEVQNRMYYYIESTNSILLLYYYLYFVYLTTSNSVKMTSEIKLPKWYFSHTTKFTCDNNIALEVMACENHGDFFKFVDLKSRVDQYTIF